VSSNNENLNDPNASREVEIKSNNNGYKLVLKWLGNEQLVATLSGPGIMLSNHVWLLACDDYLADYWMELAGAWDGWSGEKNWGSLEGDLKFFGSHDGKGTVTIKIQMQFGEPKGWVATAYLELDPGSSLGALAEEMKVFRDMQPSK
jgi:hypothetical protein